MKLPINIDDLLRQRTVESERIEYKVGWNPEAVLHTMCAFANDFHNLGGGYIIIGVEEENGRAVLPPKGIDPNSVDGIQKEILGLCHHSLQPIYNPITATYDIDGKTILVVWASGGEIMPYKAKVSLGKDAKDWTWYIRKQSSTVKARGEDERELLSLAAKVPFDDRYNQTASVEDLRAGKAVRELLSQQIIEYTIPDKPNSRMQRYQLIEKGRRLLEELGGGK